MSNTSDGLKLFRALCRAQDRGLRRHISGLAMLSFINERPEKGNVLMIGGQSLLVEVSMRISTDTASESGGKDKG